MSIHHHNSADAPDFMNKIAFLDDAKRKSTLPPEEILNMLPIQKGINVLDAGAGSGFLTIPAAKQTDGIVFAVDMDERMLEVIDTKSKS